jgi:hypothetical protein
VLDSAIIVSYRSSSLLRRFFSPPLFSSFSISLAESLFFSLAGAVVRLLNEDEDEDEDEDHDTTGRELGCARVRGSDAGEREGKTAEGL